MTEVEKGSDRQRGPDMKRKQLESRRIKIERDLNYGTRKVHRRS